jgi:hypothetical protein
MVKLLKPVVSSIQNASPAPTVEVTQKAEDEWFAAMRAEMDRKVFEKAGKMVRVSSSLRFGLIANAELLCRAGTLTRRPGRARLFVRPFPRILPSRPLTRTSCSPVGPARILAADSRHQQGALRLDGSVDIPVGCRPVQLYDFTQFLRHDLHPTFLPTLPAVFVS